MDIQYIDDQPCEKPVIIDDTFYAPPVSTTKKIKVESKLRIENLKPKNQIDRRTTLEFVKTQMNHS